MAKPTYDSFFAAAGGESGERRVLQALAALASGQNPDGTPFHPDAGHGLGVRVIPTSAGVAFPDTPCKYMILKNNTGVPLQWAFTATPAIKYPLAINAQERVNVDNAAQIFTFDAGDNGVEFSSYVIQ
jgi:hypothetical protein